MKFNKEKSIIGTFLLISIGSFFLFGLYHLSKFETTDEQLWKYGRIKNYWKAISEKDWEKTYINDKPGVTVALISGIGLFFEPNPESHKITDPKVTQGGILEVYDNSRTERINYAFRLPILIFSTLSLFLFFWLARKIFDSDWLALWSTMLIALNPIIIGMAQIINPDSFLWVFGGLAAFSFLAHLNKEEKKLFWFTAIFTGLALLSKYTAIILFLFYFLALISKIIFGAENVRNLKWIGWKVMSLVGIFFISIFIFAIFLPAVFLNPQYLFKGISQFINAKNIFVLGIFSGLILLMFLIWKNLWKKITAILQKHKNFFSLATAIIFLLIIAALLLNVWTGQKAVPLDEMKNTAYAQEPKEFNFGKLLKKDNFLIKDGKLFLMEAYPFVFSLPPLLLLLLGFISWRIFSKKINNLSAGIFFSVSLFFGLYFLMTVFARIVSNVRYSILLYSLFALLGSVAVWELSQSFKKINTKKMLPGLSLIIFLAGFWVLWFSKPFYFSYANFLLPQNFTIHDSWGHGSYEAAQYINSFPNPENLIVRPNSNTICPFLKGKCLKSRKVDLNVVQPDFFVVSKRGVLKVRNQFILFNVKDGKDAEYYHQKLEDNYDWAIFINNRPENYVKILKYEK